MLPSTVSPEDSINLVRFVTLADRFLIVKYRFEFVLTGGKLMSTGPRFVRHTIMVSDAATVYVPDTLFDLRYNAPFNVDALVTLSVLTEPFRNISPLPFALIPIG